MILDILLVISNTTFMLLMSLFLALSNYIGWFSVSTFLIFLPIILNVGLHVFIAFTIYSAVKYYHLEPYALRILKSDISYSEKIIRIINLIQQKLQ